MLAHESLQMLVRRRTIATCLFELGQREQGVVCIGRERVLHDHAPIGVLRV
jgi:hypothetical protein